MEQTEESFSYGPAHIHYRRYGNGAKNIIAFHGFGQNGSNLLPLAKLAGNDYSFYCFDLFFHGNSLWLDKELNITPEKWINLFRNWLEQNNITQFSVLGFSIGCKFAFHTLTGFPEMVENLYLLAPDGLLEHPVYSFAVNTALGRRILKELIFRPHTFFAVIRLLSTFKIVNATLLKFAASQMNTREKRWRVYNSWTSFRSLSSNPDKVAALLNQYKIPTVIYIGKYDRVITTKNVSRFTDSVTNCKLHIIEAGHSDFIERMVKHSPTRELVTNTFLVPALAWQRQ